MRSIDSSEKGNNSTLLTSVRTTLIVLTSLGVILIALRNSVTQHLENFWGASANFWQQQWDYLLLVCGNDQFWVMFAGLYVLTYLVYWIGAAGFLFMDFTNTPKFMRAYKIQPGTNEPLDFKKFMRLFAVVNFNQLVLGLVATYLAYYMMEFRGYDSGPNLPTFHYVLMELALFVIMEEIGFYYTHRILHHRLLYKHVHKLHHEWQSPIAPTVLYCHPVEFFFSNVIPGYLGPALTGSHLSTFILWTQIQIIFSLHQHSGYHLPLMPSPEAHDYHHLKFTQCFGVLGILDLIHGTDDRFRSSKCFSRDFVSFTLTPLREAIPDNDKKRLK